MSRSDRTFPLRWVLPFAQFLICLALLWPVRSVVFAGATVSFYGPQSKVDSGRQTTPGDIVVNPYDERKLADVVELWETRKLAPLVLNFPVLVVQLPYAVLSPAKREWVPRGMFPDMWRALSWPVAGMFFWWLLGRGVEALSAARRSVVRPPIGWLETSFAGILFVFGVVALVGLLTSTPDDRHDLHFMALAVGGLAWGILATSIITARFLQLRIAKRNEAKS